LLAISLLTVSALSFEYKLEGDKAVSVYEIKKSIDLEKPQTDRDSIKAIIEGIKTAYQSAGYFDCRVRADTSDIGFFPDTVVFRIEKGNLFYFGETSLTGLNSISENELGDYIGELKGKRADDDNLNEYLQRILHYYGERGYPYTSVNVSDFAIVDSNGLVDLTININEGPRVYTDSVIILGNKVTHDYVIRREIQLHKGDVFMLGSLRLSAERINRLGFVSIIGEPKLFYGRELSKGIVVFNIRERKSSTVGGVFGYVPSTRTRKGYISGVLDITLNNILGTGRKSNLYYATTDPESKEIRFSYTEPYFLGLPFYWTLSAEQIDRDSTYIKISGGIDISYRLGAYTALEAKLATQRTTPGKRGLYPEEHFTGTSVGVAVIGDYSDYPPNPRRGYSFDIAVKYLKKNYYRTGDYIPPESQSKKTSAEISTVRIFRISANSILHFSGKVAGLNKTDIYLPISERFPIGGRGTVRGYLEGRYYGALIAYIRSEYRLLSGRDGRIFVFSDNGYYYFRDKENKSQNAILTGFGMGAASMTPLGIFTVEFAWGKGNSFGEGKFYFGLENRF